MLTIITANNDIPASDICGMSSLLTCQPKIVPLCDMLTLNKATSLMVVDNKFVLWDTTLVKVWFKKKKKKKKRFYYSVEVSKSISQTVCPVGWGCRIHWLHLHRGLRPPPPTHTNKCPGSDTKQSDGEVPLMLELWRM